MVAATSFYAALADSIPSVNATPRSVIDRFSFAPVPEVVGTHPYARLTIANVPGSCLADTVALVLAEFCKAPRVVNHMFPNPADPAALFFSPFKQKSFTLSYYCRRLLDYNCCSKSCFPIAILYLVRLAERYPIFEINDYNVHRLICTAVLLAAKWVDDVSYSNAHYAKVGGIQTAVEMSRLEAHMLKALDYRLFITKESFEEVESRLIQIALTPK